MMLMTLWQFEISSTCLVSKFLWTWAGNSVFSQLSTSLCRNIILDDIPRLGWALSANLFIQSAIHTQQNVYHFLLISEIPCYWFPNRPSTLIVIQWAFSILCTSECRTILNADQWTCLRWDKWVCLIMRKVRVSWRWSKFKEIDGHVPFRKIEGHVLEEDRIACPAER